MFVRRLGLESLESRQMLAGNVTVSVVNSELLISGDTAANRIVVTEVAGGDSSYRSFRITGQKFDGAFDANGLPVAGTTATKVNGGDAAVVKFIGSDKVRITLGGGNDAVSFGTSAAITTTAALNINTGAGRDYVRVERVKPTASNTTLNVNTGTDAEANNELVQLLSVGTPEDQAVNTTQHVSVSTGGGNDRVVVDRLRLGGNVLIGLGKGSDALLATSVDVNKVTVNGGTSEHRDTITIGSLKANEAAVNLGAGNDLITITALSVIYGNSVVDGGAGTDELLSNGNILSFDLDLLNMEIDDLP
jgi:large repetitive protein